MGVSPCALTVGGAETGIVLGHLLERNDVTIRCGPNGKNGSSAWVSHSDEMDVVLALWLLSWVRWILSLSRRKGRGYFTPPLTGDGGAPLARGPIRETDF